MHFLLALGAWAISFGTAVQTGRAWVESQHAGGLPRVAAWALAALSAAGFTVAYFLLIVSALENHTVGAIVNGLASADLDTLTPDMTTGIWNLWLQWLAAPLIGLAGSPFLGAWARTYREAATNASDPRYAALNDRYASITTTPQAMRTVTNDLRSRTNARLFGGSGQLVGRQLATAVTEPRLTTVTSGTHRAEGAGIQVPEIGGNNEKGGAVVLLIVVAVIATCLGVITTWVIISRIAGEAEPMPTAAA